MPDPLNNAPGVGVRLAGPFVIIETLGGPVALRYEAVTAVTPFTTVEGANPTVSTVYGNGIGMIVLASPAKVQAAILHAYGAIDPGPGKAEAPPKLILSPRDN